MSNAREIIAAALADYDAVADRVGSCGDGGCLVKRPVGIHTNGGCRCAHDKLRAQRMMWAGQRLADAIRTLTKN